MFITRRRAITQPERARSPPTTVLDERRARLVTCPTLPLRLPSFGRVSAGCVRRRGPRRRQRDRRFGTRQAAVRALPGKPVDGRPVRRSGRIRRNVTTRSNKRGVFRQSRGWSESGSRTSALRVGRVRAWRLHERLRNYRLTSRSLPLFA